MGGGTCGIYRSAVAPRTDTERINEASCAGGIKADVGSSTGLQLDPGTEKSSFITGRVPTTVPHMHFASFPSTTPQQKIWTFTILSFNLQFVKFGLIYFFYIYNNSNLGFQHLKQFLCIGIYREQGCIHTERENYFVARQIQSALKFCRWVLTLKAMNTHRPDIAPLEKPVCIFPRIITSPSTTVPILSFQLPPSLLSTYNGEVCSCNVVSSTSGCMLTYGGGMS